MLRKSERIGKESVVCLSCCESLFALLAVGMGIERVMMAGSFDGVEKRIFESAPLQQPRNSQSRGISGNRPHSSVLIAINTQAELSGL